MSDTFLRRTRIATWAAVAGLGALARVRPRMARAATLGLVGSIGIAHGATDVDALVRTGMRLRGGRTALSLGYGALAVGTFVAARMLPRIAGWALYALSAWHFGSGDVAFARASGSRVGGLGEVFVRGMLPISVGGRDAVSLGFAALAAARTLVHLGRGRTADALDLAIPTTLLLAMPKREGFAVYFGAWHAVRHTALLLARDRRHGGMPLRARRFARESAPNVLIAVGAGIVAWFLDRRRTSASRTSYVPQSRNDDVFGALILAITVPHEIAVRILERHAAT
jgi:hypothetical protein